MAAKALRRIAPAIALAFLTTLLAGTPGAGATTVDNNPNLARACGIDLTLVLDRSGSLSGSPGATLQTAANSFLDSLVGTGSTVSMVSFATNADDPLQNQDPTEDIASVQSKVDDLVFNGSTNWEDGLLGANGQLGAFDNGKPQLVIMITDGFANKYNEGAGVAGTGSGFVQLAQDKAVVQADLIKEDVGAHMFVLGVAGSNGGPATINQSALQAISGPDEYTDGGTVPFSQADWAKVDGIGNLAGVLQSIAKEICGGELSLTKDGPDQAHPGDTVTYTFTVENNGRVDLEDVDVTDEMLGGAIHHIDFLAVGDTETFTAPYLVPANQQDDLVNTAEVCGGIPETTDEICAPPATHTVDVIHPAITIVKTANPTTVTDSGEVTFTYVVTNTGDVTLTDVAVNDDVLGAIGTIDSLESHESKTLTKKATVKAGSQLTNIGTAEGTDPLGLKVNASDDAVVTLVITPPAPPAAPANPAVVPAVVTPVDVLGIQVEAAPVVAPAVVAPAAELPRTGSESSRLLLMGELFLLAGFAALVLAATVRRRGAKLN